MSLQRKLRIFAGRLREAVDGAFSRLGYRFVKEDALTSSLTPTLIDYFFPNGKEVFFLQIGANDGVQGDYLTRFRARRSWSGFLLEPSPIVFARLAANVSKAGNPGVRPLQLALAQKNAPLPFYVVDREKQRQFPSLPKETDTWSSLSHAALEGLIADHGVPKDKAAGLIREISVRAVTFDTLIADHDVSRIDLLLMDVEGLDAVLLPLFPLERFLPRMVICERDKMTVAELDSIKNRFREAGYLWLLVGPDVIFFRQN